MKSLEFLARRERFLPVQEATLLEWVLADPRLSEAERAGFRQWFEMISARFHHEYRRSLTELQTLYDPFDPDRDTLPLGEVSAEELGPRRAGLSDAFARLLEEGNYAELPRSQIVSCVELQTGTGLTVVANLGEYEQLRVFYRGVRRQWRERRPTFQPWKRIGQEVHVFSRAVLLVRLGRDPDHVLLKIFKNVVAEDLEMILPYVRICMRWLDVLKIGSSAAGSVATASWKVFTAAFLSPLLFGLVLAGFATATVKASLSFFASKTRYLQTLTSNLYFQNLANNRSALALLVASAEAEEVKEILLAYYTLYVERDRDYTVEELDRRVEAWLGERLGTDVDFEVADAVRKLIDKGLVVERDDGPARRVLKVYDLPSALSRLDQVWDNLYSYARPHGAGQDRLADHDHRTRPRVPSSPAHPGEQ